MFYSTNSSKIQVNVKGYKLVENKTVSGINLQTYTNGIMAYYYIHNDNAISITDNSKEIALASSYPPISFLSAPARHWGTARALFTGNLLLVKNTETKIEWVQVGVSGLLKTPLY